MKLEKFKEINNKKIGILIFTVCCILLITGVYLYSSFAIYEQNQNFNVINGTVKDPGDLYFAFYVDDIISKNMPSKDSGYILDTEKSNCTKGAIPILNETDWSIKVQNLTETHTKCTLYFTKPRSIVDEIIAKLDTSGSCPIVSSDGTVNVTGSEITNGYVCSAPDDYGTSYYFRGNVTDNYVKFGDYYWRILRINGDGTIRIIYDGTSAHANDEASVDRTIGESKFNEEIMNEEMFISPVGVGYMHGDKYRENTNDSVIKTYVDNWFQTNIESRGLSNYLSDELFCNDRTLIEGDGESAFDESYYRWNYGPWSSDNINYPILTCQDKADAFTVNESEKTNGKLTYPIGLITADEVILAGAYENSDMTDGTIQKHYLYTGCLYWTMSAYYSTATGGTLRVVSGGGRISESTNPSVVVTQSNYVKPVINLKSDALKVGSGTADDPYMLSIE